MNIGPPRQTALRIRLRWRELQLLVEGDGRIAVWLAAAVCAAILVAVVYLVAAAPQ